MRLRVARFDEQAMREPLNVKRATSAGSHAFLLYLVGPYGEPGPICSRMLHIGNCIQAELRRQERSVAWFARKLSCDRSNVYNIFLRNTIDTELLMRISIVLNHNFFIDYVQDFENSLKTPRSEV